MQAVNLNARAYSMSDNVHCFTKCITVELRIAIRERTQNVCHIFCVNPDVLITDFHDRLTPLLWISSEVVI